MPVPTVIRTKAGPFNSDAVAQYCTSNLDVQYCPMTVYC